MLYLLRYGEVGLKSPYVMRQLLDRLVSNLQDLFEAAGAECILRREFGRVFLWASNDTRATEILGRTFGVVSFSPVQEVPSAMDAVSEGVLALARPALSSGQTFAIRARRSGREGPTSLEVARALGTAVLKTCPGVRVDLDAPDVELFVEMRGPKAYLFTKVFPGPGGLPLGSQGKVSVFVDGPGGAVAAWVMMKRGCRTFVGGPKVEAWVESLRRYDPKLRTFPAEDLASLEAATVGKGSRALVVGWGIKDVVEAQPAGRLRIFHPLVGYSPPEVEALATRLGS